MAELFDAYAWAAVWPSRGGIDVATVRLRRKDTEIAAIAAHEARSPDRGYSPDATPAEKLRWLMSRGLELREVYIHACETRGDR